MYKGLHDISLTVISLRLKCEHDDKIEQNSLISNFMEISSHLTYYMHAYFATFHCKGTEKMNHFTPISEMRNASVTFKYPGKPSQSCVGQYKIKLNFCFSTYTTSSSRNGKNAKPW